MNSSVSDFFHALALALVVTESYVRMALLFLIAAPAFFIIIAVLGGQWLVGWLALVALFAGLVVLTHQSPILIAASTVEVGRKVSRVLLAVVVFDLVLALYLGLVPVYSNPKLIPIVVLSGVVVVLTASSDHSGMGCLRGILICCIVIVTFAFFFSSKDVSNFVQQMNESSRPTSQTSQAYPDCTGTTATQLTILNPSAQIALHSSCWSGDVQIAWPFGTQFDFNFHYSGKWASVKRGDGQILNVWDDGTGGKRDAYVQLDSSNRFKVRGEENSILTMTVKTR